ncbi:MAG TPA: hypothetical protein VNL70_03375 [Tepidisphaeraceae bacterium]|nr:hypothetical protein [Tepidisphaeraceae bacterium]
MAPVNGDLEDDVAEEPKPKIASLSRGPRPLRFSARYPMMPAHSNGAAEMSSKTSGIEYAKS